MITRRAILAAGVAAPILELNGTELRAAVADGGKPGERGPGQPVDITDFGIVAGDDEALARSNSDAVDRMLAYLLAHVPNPEQLGTAAIKVTAPAGHFRFARKWELKQALWIEGQSNSQMHAYATHFEFDEAGFVANRFDTLNGAKQARPTTGADGFRLENLYCTSRAATGTGFHGLHAACRGDVVRCSFNLFPGSGIRVETPTAFGATANANSTRILYCQFTGNGESGLHLIGGDANCVVTVGCAFSNNGEFGLFDNGFLSNSHTGHYAEGNGLGLVFPGHKISAVSSTCHYPFSPWRGGATVGVGTESTYRTSGGTLYRLLAQGPGATANAPAHKVPASAGGVKEADGYRWSYEGTTLSRRYHVALGQSAAASATVPGTNSSVWVPYEFGGGQPGIPLWSEGMRWREGGSYCSASAVAETVWTACYSEGSQPPAQIRNPAVWIGGQTPPSPWSSCAQVRAEHGAISNPQGFLASRQFHDGGQLRALFAPDLGRGHVLYVGHETLHKNSFVMAAGSDTYFLLDGQPENFLTFTGPLTTFTGGRSKPQPGVTVAPRLFLGAGASARNIDYGSAPPASGHHAAGELVFNVAPSAGGFVGWVCTAAGTPGTWKSFGAISQ